MILLLGSEFIVIIMMKINLIKHINNYSVNELVNEEINCNYSNSENNEIDYPENETSEENIKKLMK